MQTDHEQNVKVAIKYLKPGWVVDQHLYSGSTLLLKRGSVISEQVLGLLKRRGIEYLSISKASSLAGYSEKPAAGLSFPSESIRTLDEVYALHDVIPAVPQALMESTATKLNDVLAAAQDDYRVNIGLFRQTVDPVITKFLERSANSVWLKDQSNMKTYIVNHGLKTGLFYMIVAQDWCNSEEELRNQVYGAILKDIGTSRISPAIINKPGPLSAEEWKAVKRHPILGAKLLTDANASEEMLSIALSHHERLDGTGYPYGLKGEEVDRYARLAAICDIYDALTSTRVYRKRIESAFAVDAIIKACGSHLDADLVNRFIRRVGRFPVGSLVELSSGEIALVVRINEKAIRCPVVSCIIGADGEPYGSRNEIDLSDRTDIYIKQAVTPDTAGLE